MGREIKRVSLDFDWFETHRSRNGNHAKTWKGYIFDLDIKCFLCNGEGKNLKGKRCPLCDGDKTIHPRFEPPKNWNDKNNGYQVWENVSEGSPASPVFKKPEDLAKWMVENDNSVTRNTSYEAWLSMIKEEGSVPSFVGSMQGGFSTGTSLYEKKEEQTPKEE